jgi:hypothetical protein
MRIETHNREHSHRKDCWYSELRSLGIEPLGIEPKRPTELNDIEELGKLADNIKQTMFQDYETAFNDETVDESHFDYII